MKLQPTRNLLECKCGHEMTYLGEFESHYKKVHEWVSEDEGGGNPRYLDVQIEHWVKIKE